MFRKYTEFQYTPAPHMDNMHAQSQFHVWLFGVPWAPLSMGFSWQEYWSALPFLLQGIILTQRSNPHLMHCKWIICAGQTQKTMGSILHHNIQKSIFVILPEPTMTHHYCPKCIVTLEFIFGVAHSIDFAKEHFQYF